MNERKTLKDLDIHDIYSSQMNNLVEEFYNPVLELAQNYDRITGFFSPRVFAAAARGFANLVKTGGKIRLVTSVEVSPEVFEVLQNDSFSCDDLEKYTKWDISDIETELEKNYLAVFAYLLASGQMEIRVVVTEHQSGILHQKIGIITDSEGNSISFSGSINETVYGWQQNIEEFKVFKQWTLYGRTWYQSDINTFLSLWNNTSPGAKTIPLGLAVKEKILCETTVSENINEVLDKIKHLEKQPGKDIDTVPEKKLFDYQEEAIDFWFDNGCTGVFEMATGTGKTFTTVQALNRFKKERGALQAIITVPLASLVTQWQGELLNSIEDCLIVTTATSSWRNTINQLVRLSKFNKVNKPNFIIVTTYNLFNRKDVQELLSAFAPDLLLVADEMHNLVTENGIKAASSPFFSYRLGLSATPSRLWKPQASACVMKIFGDHKFVFSIEQAIERGFLVPFNYYPEAVELTGTELTEYLELSYRIRKKRGLAGRTDMEDFDDEQLKKMFIKRARIKKEAEAKLNCLRDLLLSLRRTDQLHHALIYVDNEDYLTKVQLMLKEHHIKSSKIIGDTPKSEREQVISSLEDRQIDAIVAIKCLDEGIDIPSAQKAFIISNNTDPREYVQRLGRVLRVDRKNCSKKFADIYDFIVTPPAATFSDGTDRDIVRSLVCGELTRSEFFTKIALNGDDAKFQLFDLAASHGFVFRPEELCYNGEEE